LPLLTDTLTQPSDVNIIKAASMLSSDSKEKQISRLLQEIDLLKDQNRKVRNPILFPPYSCARFDLLIYSSSVTLAFWEGMQSVLGY